MPQSDSQLHSRISTLSIDSDANVQPGSLGVKPTGIQVTRKRRRTDKLEERLDPAIHPRRCEVQSTPRAQSFADARYELRDAVAPIGADIPSPEIPGLPRRITLPSSSQEAYLLLEAARSDHLMSALRKDLAFELVHRNIIALQLNRIMLERAEEDLSNADEQVGYVRLSIRESGYSVAAEYAICEDQGLLRRRTRTLSNSNSPIPFAALDVVLD